MFGVASVGGFTSFEAAALVIAVCIIAFCYLLTLFNGYRSPRP